VERSRRVLPTLKSMSSENRLMSSNPFESEVPPEKAGAMPHDQPARWRRSRTTVPDELASVGDHKCAAAVWRRVVDAVEKLPTPHFPGRCIVLRH
jgi:hypothetical protein